MRISLKAARITRGLTQEALAEKLGVSKKTISCWENGKTVPNLNKIDAICDVFNLKYDDIEWKH